MINFNEIDRLRSLIERSKRDRLLSFVISPEIDKFNDLLESNLQLLFTEARKYKVRYLYVGKGEICGCEDARDGSWPAMWSIARTVGFPGSCGNGDQYQCQGSDRVFPDDSYGGWDLVENIKLSDEETTKKKFCRVVTRHRV